jgi:hypothetical protein
MRYRGDSYLLMISIASTHRSKLTSVSFTINEFGEYCGDELGLHLELGGELLEQEKDNMGVSDRRLVSGALGACFAEQGEEAVL